MVRHKSPSRRSAQIVIPGPQKSEAYWASADVTSPFSIDNIAKLALTTIIALLGRRGAPVYVSMIFKLEGKFSNLG